MSIIVSSPGKVILMGEHAVVHGQTCIAAATDLRLFVKLENNQENKILRLRIIKTGNEIIPVIWSEQNNEQKTDGHLNATDTDKFINIEWSLNSINQFMRQLKEKIPKELLLESEQQKPAKAAVAKIFKESLSTFSTSIDGRSLALSVDWSCQSLLLLLFLAKEKNESQFEDFTEGLYIDVSSQLPMSRGLGSSAAFCVSLSGALHLYYQKKNSQLMEINEKLRDVIAAHSAITEHLIHGNPSGVDTSVSCYGGIVAFRPILPVSKQCERISLSDPIKVILVDTGVDRQTRLLVQGVALRLSERKEIYLPCIEILGQLSEQIFSILNDNKDENQKKKIVSFLEHRMQFSHTLLNVLGVGHPKLERVCEIAIQNGYQGCKLTGAGGGGCAVIMTSKSVSSKLNNDNNNNDKYQNEQNENNLIKCLNSDGFVTYNTSLGTNGVTFHQDFSNHLKLFNIN